MFCCLVLLPAIAVGAVISKISTRIETAAIATKAAKAAKTIRRVTTEACKRLLLRVSELCPLLEAFIC